MISRITELSPLDQIRLVEADVARQIVAARETTEEKVAKVRTHAEQIVYMARDAGRKDGEEHYKNILLKAEEEAQAIVARAQHHAAEMKLRGEQSMARLTLIAFDTVIGLKGEAAEDEH